MAKIKAKYKVGDRIRFWAPDDSACGTILKVEPNYTYKIQWDDIPVSITAFFYETELIPVYNYNDILKDMVDRPNKKG